MYIDPDFLSADHCQEICKAIRQGELSEAGLYSDSAQESSLDAVKRQSYFADVPATIKEMVDDKIRKLQPELEQHFKESFNKRFEASKFLLYREGHFFAPHRDNQLGRRVNMSIYLNDQTDEPADGSYSGGMLKIYGLIDRPDWENRGVDLCGKRGMLVAYPAHLIHEITPVLSGERYAIVSRFLDAQA
ncbi:MAG: 2OG-Fe(II) oxygenase [Parasphingorhabdus sp.]